MHHRTEQQHPGPGREHGDPGRGHPDHHRHAPGCPGLLQENRRPHQQMQKRDDRRGRPAQLLPGQNAPEEPHRCDHHRAGYGPVRRTGGSPARGHHRLRGRHRRRTVEGRASGKHGRLRGLHRHGRSERHPVPVCHEACDQESGYQGEPCGLRGRDRRAPAGQHRQPQTAYRPADRPVCPGCRQQHGIQRGNPVPAHERTGGGLGIPPGQKISFDRAQTGGNEDQEECADRRHRPGREADHSRWPGCLPGGGYGDRGYHPSGLPRYGKHPGIKETELYELSCDRAGA